MENNKKYVIIRQDVYNHVDSVELHDIYDSLEDANDELVRLHAQYYSKYDTKLLPRTYLYMCNSFNNPTVKIYYRILWK